MSGNEGREAVSEVHNIAERLNLYNAPAEERIKRVTSLHIKVCGLVLVWILAAVVCYAANNVG